MKIENLQSPEVREALKAELEKHKRKTGKLLGEIIEMMGYSKSTAVRYLNGSLKMNEKFVNRVANVVDKPIAEILPSTPRAFVKIGYTMSGKKIENRTISVPFQTVNETSFAVIVDVKTHGLRENSTLIVDGIETPRENEYVVLVKSDRCVYGVLEHEPAALENVAWAVKEMLSAVDIRYHPVHKDDAIYPVSAVCFTAPKEAKTLTF
ncbi:hypothetical protein [Pasteurella testudinis]|uniref:hypothetical protein n=1 Tax=Pasteurella testudinis TaxID=761 RepID=UPI00405800C2